MIPIEKAAAYVVRIAEAEVGYLEKASNAYLNDKTANAGSNNWTKYAAYFDALRGEYAYYNGPKNGFDWCDMFFDWCQCQAWGIDVGRKIIYQPMESAGAGCPYSASYYRANNAWFSVPKAGDQIFFGRKGKETHTGIVVDVSGSKVVTVEGNSGQRVARRSYALSDGNIAGYGRPNYQLVAYKFTEATTPDTPIQDDKEDEMTEAEVKKLVAAELTKIPKQAPTRQEIMDATNDQWVDKFTSLPDWAKPEVRELIEMGAIKGTVADVPVEDTVINASVQTFIRPAIVAYRAVKALVSNAPKEAVREVIRQMLESI